MAEKHFVKIGSRTGFIKKSKRSFIEDRRCIGGFGNQRDRGVFLDLAEKRSTVFLKAKYPGIGNVSGCFCFLVKKDPDKVAADSRTGNIPCFQKIRKLGKTCILISGLQDTPDQCNR